MRGIKAGIDDVKAANPNFVEIASKEAFRSRRTASVADPIPQPPSGLTARFWPKAARARAAAMQRRASLHIGMPRVLNMYTYAPFFNGYFESLGVPAGNCQFPPYSAPHVAGHWGPGVCTRLGATRLRVIGGHAFSPQWGPGVFV
jgi:hypothetical protein